LGGFLVGFYLDLHKTRGFWVSALQTVLSLELGFYLFSFDFWKSFAFTLISTFYNHLTLTEIVWLFDVDFITAYQRKWQTYTPWAIKNVTLYFCTYLRQLLTDFQNFFTGTLCRQFAIMCLLYIPPNHQRVSTLPCEI